MGILKRTIIAWKRYDAWKFIYLVAKNLRFYIKKLFSGDVLQSTTESEFDDEFGTDTEVIREISSLDDIALSENYLHATRYAPSPYHVTTKIFQELSIDHTRFSFIDFGSGKGRVLLIASQLPFKSVIGVEFSRELCEIANSNIAKIPPSKCAASWVGCVHTDVMEYRLPGNSNRIIAHSFEVVLHYLHHFITRLPNFFFIQQRTVIKMTKKTFKSIMSIVFFVLVMLLTKKTMISININWRPLDWNNI